MFRADRLAGKIEHQLTNRNAVDNELPPVPHRATPSQPGDSQAGPVIPREVQGIGLLPLAEQAAALAQRTCPVTGDLLGADGKPLKVQIGNRTVFVCCESCVKELKADPQAFLSKNKRP